MITDFSASVFGLTLIAVAAYIFWSLTNQKPRQLLHRLYLYLVLLYAVWAVIMLAMWVVPPERTDILQILDALTYIGGGGIPAFYFLLALCFTNGNDHLPRWSKALFIVPVITVIICLTNELHHLQYQVFSIIRSEIVFGPYMPVNGVYSYLCLIASAVLLIHFARHNPSRLYVGQCAMLILGGLCPLGVSILATFSGLDFPITATPLSFMLLVLFKLAFPMRIW